MTLEYQRIATDRSKNRSLRGLILAVTLIDVLLMVSVALSLCGVSVSLPHEFRVTLQSRDHLVYFAIKQDDQFWVWLGAPLYVVTLVLVGFLALLYFLRRRLRHLAS
jgi:hypothetical protein